MTIINHSVSADLTITGVQLAGTHPGEFLISEDSGETVLAPGAERIVAVRFNPATVGRKTATLRVVAANLPGGAVEVSLTGTAVAGTLPADPATPSPAKATSGVWVNPMLDRADRCLVELKPASNTLTSPTAKCPSPSIWSFRRRGPPTTASRSGMWCR